MVYVIQICWQLASRIGTESVLILLASCQQTCMTYTIAVCTAENSWYGQWNCSKHAEFYSKNKSEKLMHFVGFVIRIHVGGLWFRFRSLYLEFCYLRHPRLLLEVCTIWSYKYGNMPGEVWSAYIPIFCFKSYKNSSYVTRHFNPTSYHGSSYPFFCRYQS